MNGLRLPLTLAFGALIFGAVFWQQDRALRREVTREPAAEYAAPWSDPNEHRAATIVTKEGHDYVAVFFRLPSLRAPQSAMVRP